MRLYINQAGYLPGSIKTVILAEEADKQKKHEFMAEKVIRIYPQGDETCILEKKAEYFGLDEASGDDIWRADFSELTQDGIYRIKDEEGNAVSVRVHEKIYDVMNQILCKALYYQRCGMELEEPYAGIFRRKSCHEDKAVLLEDYEKLGTEAEGTVKWFDVRGGWHDAGDYGKYTTAAAAALAHILYAYEVFPESFGASLNIPESGNGIPDILNECLYELRWLLKMQMEDGSVCHKVTSRRHANFVMPHEDKRQMILFPVSSMAAADFAAIMALAHRVYRNYDRQFAGQALEAAKKAWDWLEEHPEFTGFQNPEGCNTGDYADTDDQDERLWAAAELYRVTGDEKYLACAGEFVEKVSNLTAMGWTDVAGFAGWAFLEAEIKKNSRGTAETDKEITDQREVSLCTRFRNSFLKEAEKILKIQEQCGYFAALKRDDYGWGSNMVLLNRAMISGTAYLLCSEKRYREAVTKQMDYLLGVNAVGYSYVTEVGFHSCRNPHNRVAAADGIGYSIPGFVVGGPNEHPADEKAEWLIVPGTPPMKCYLDIWECYSLNEITIYWNSPAIFAAAFLECFAERQ